jgi:GLPGLI family protein
MIKRIILPLYLLIFTQLLIAQNTIKQGKIYYEMDFPDIPANQKQAMASILPKDATAYFKDGKTRVETPTPFGKMIIIRDIQKKEFVFAFNNIEKRRKVAFKKTDEEVKLALSDTNKVKIKVEITKDTKLIAGYKGTKAIVTATVNGKLVVSEYWYSNEIPKINMGNDQDEIFSKIDGGLLEYTVNQGDMHIVMRIRQVVVEEISNKLFEIGEAYKIVKDEEELANEMMK